MKSLRRLLYIFLIPLAPIIFWYFSDYIEYNLPDFELKAGFYEPSQLNKIIDSLPEINESIKENITPVEFVVKENPLKNISDAFNQTMVDKFGHFANLPTHRTCLVNKNKISSEGVLVEPQDNIGAIGINTETNKALEFYAEVDDKNCKSVLKEDFFNEKFFPPEYVYPVFKEIGPEDIEKVYNGEEYNIYLRQISINASNSYVVIRLNHWFVFIAYLLLVLAWSLTYFQIRKIIYHVRGAVDTQ